MHAARLGLVGIALLPLAWCPAAGAQAVAEAPPQSSPATSEAGKDGETRKENEIVVTANQYYGQASVATETEFGEAEIAGQGADSIQGLLDRLTPFIDPAGNEPVLLINGRPAEGDRSILSYPPEALNRVAVLKPDAAARYGYASDRRVVNLVLKKHFSSMNLDAGGWTATRGGQYGGELSAGRVAIDGPSRWSATARITQDSALRKSARDIAPAPGIFDGTGIVTGLVGGEIDPGLSLAAGRPISRAAIPSGAEWQQPGLADFAAAADRTAPVDPNAFETLLPSKRALLFNAGVSHPLGAFTASLNLNASSTETNALRGLPMASVVLPAGNPWSPFSGDVLLVRPLAGTRALRNDNSAQMLGAALSLTGRVSGWQLALSASYARNWSDSLLERGIDLPRVQALLDAGDPGLNPYGPWSRQLLLTNRNHSQGESISARLNAIGKMLDLPAGPLTANATINLAHNTLESRISASSADTLVMTRQSSRIDGQLSINLPISGRTRGALGPLGDVTIDLIAGGQAISGASLQKRYGAGFTWAPARFVQLRGTLENVDAAPTPEQLDAPVVTTINRIFDYARQEAVDAVWILGGNPGLRRGTRQNRSLTAMLRPLSDQVLTLNFGYAEQVAKGGVAPFPELTPAIEAAFPERIVRDATGRLVSVDARPINLVGETSADFSSGVALRLPRRRASPAPQAAADPINWTLSLNYRRRLKSELRTRPGLPVIDQLGDDSGQSRDRLSLQLSAGKRGIGASLNGSWSGTARLRNRASPGSDYRFSAWSTLNLSAFVEPEHLLAKTGHDWLKDIKLSLEIRNLFNGYRRVRLPDGSIPLGYSHDEIDPLGRTARLTLRKRF